MIHFGCIDYYPRESFEDIASRLIDDLKTNNLYKEDLYFSAYSAENISELQYLGNNTPHSLYILGCLEHELGVDTAHRKDVLFEAFKFDRPLIAVYDDKYLVKERSFALHRYLPKFRRVKPLIAIYGFNKLEYSLGLVVDNS